MSLSNYEARPKDFGNPTWVAFQTLARTEIRRFMRIWVQTLVPPAITMTLYFVIFGNLIGSRIGQMDGFDYMAFIVPGLIMMSVITNSYTNVAGSFFSSKFNRYVEEILVSPISNQTILLGYIAGGVARALIVGGMVTLLSLFFTNFPIHNLLAISFITLLTSIFFSVLGFINGVYAKNFDEVSFVPTFFLTPLTYLGGVFFSIDLLSDFWAGIARLNPILYVVNAFRHGILGITDVSLWTAYGLLISMTVISYIVAVQLLARGVGVRF